MLKRGAGQVVKTAFPLNECIFKITETKVKITMGGIKWIFDRDTFTEAEKASLEHFANGRFHTRCGGCKTLPSNGYRSDKVAWCGLTRKLATAQQLNIARKKILVQI